MVDQTLPTGDRAQQRWPSRHWLLATGLLLLAAALFSATYLDPQPDFWTMLLRRATEASLVGGIADWFAVVALFRHPLGIPIPHTAVIPNNKERIAVKLSRFVEDHILQPETVAARLRTADLSRSMANWLSDEANAALLAERATRALAAFAGSVPEVEWRAFVRRAALRGIATVDAATLLSMALKAMYDAGRHQELFDELMGEARVWIRSDPGRIRALVEQRTAWWVPRLVDRGLAKAVAEHAEEALLDLTAPGSTARRDFDVFVARLIDDLRTSPRHRDRIESIKRDLLASPELEDALDRVAVQLRTLIVEDVAEHRSTIRTAVADAVLAFGRRLAADEALRSRLERRLIWFARSAVQPWRQNIGRFIADVMRSWDSRTVADRLERAVGRDLQYVRINGTLVGGLVGAGLFLLTEL